MDLHPRETLGSEMDNLAPEIQLKIYKLACTDGGFTGCSLSRVSKHVRTMSRSVRFHSVALSGTARQLADFLSFFTEERASAGVINFTPFVRHLFFAVAEGGESKRDWRIESHAWDYNVDDLEQAAVDAARRTYMEDVATLFCLIALDLQTLSLVHCHGWEKLTHLSDIKCPGGFPNLRELTIVGNDPFVGALASVFYPSLTHLHLDFPSWTHKELPSWAARSPHVTHLCLSEINEITNHLEDLASSGSPFAELSRLYVQPEAPPAPGGWCGNPYIEHAMFMCDFAVFPDAAAIPTHALRHRDGAIEEWTRREWLDRIRGGMGCWIPFEPKADDIIAPENVWDGSVEKIEEFLTSLSSTSAHRCFG